MGEGKYVAYVSTYTMGKGDNHGIKIYDVDMENGRLLEKDQVEITNSSYVTISHTKNIFILLRILEWSLTEYCRMANWICLAMHPLTG